MAEHFEMQLANLYCGDADPDKSQYLVLENVKMVALQQRTKDHAGGGAAFGLKVVTRQYEAPEFTFKLKGFNPDIIDQFMGTDRRKYTLLGMVRELEANRKMQVKMVIEGCMTKIDMGDFSPGEGNSTDYEIAEIVKLQFEIDNKEKIYLDYFAGPLGVRVNGVNIFADEARFLGLS